MFEASALLACLERIDVSSELLRDVHHAHAKAAAQGSREPLSTVIFGCVGAHNILGNRADIVLAAKIRILSLATLARDHVLDEWVRREDDPNGIVLFHGSLFRAA